jgi:hypothetical protein
MKKQNACILLCFCVLLVFFTGTAFAKSEEPVSIETNEPEAVCFIDNFSPSRLIAIVINHIRSRRTQPEPEPEPKPHHEDFILTISVEETTLNQGENFRVNVELKNNSGEDREITHSFLFMPYIPNWNLLADDMGGIAIDPPEPQTRLLEADGILKNIGLMGDDAVEPWLIGTALEPGTHELTFRARFHVFFGSEAPRPYQEFEVWSNAIMLTVE